MIIAVYYVSLSEAPTYREMAELSIKTAVKANPGARVLHATDQKTDPIMAAHGVMRLDIDATPEGVVPGKARLTSWLGKFADEPWCVVDADVVHRSPLSPLLEDCDVALLRRDKPVMNINAGLILGRPGFVNFWSYYEAGVTVLIRESPDMPRICHPWWAEQMAFSGMVGSLSCGGVEIFDARVKLLEMNEVLPRADSLEHARTLPGVGIHFKGAKAKTFADEYAKEVLGEA